MEPPERSDDSPLRLAGILETTLYCDDLERARQFYGEVLGLERIGYEEGRHVFFRCGDGVLLIFDPEHTSTQQTDVEGAPIPLHGSRGPGHLAFRSTAAELEAWKRHLRGHDVDIEAEVDWPNGGRSFYFRDPAGNSLELATPDLWDL